MRDFIRFDGALSLHILYHHRTAGRGGEGQHIMNIVKAIEAAGHQVTIVSPPGVDPRRNAGGRPLDKGAEKQRGINRVWRWLSVWAPQFLFELAELSYNVFAYFRLRSLMRKHAFDAFFERNAFFLFASSAVAAHHKLPICLEVNEVVGIPRARKQFLVRLARYFESKVFSRCDCIFAVSSFLKTEVQKRGGSNRVLLMPNGIDPARFSGQNRGRMIREKLGFQKSVVVGFVGWFDPWDRLDLLIDAVSHLRKTDSRISLLLVGDGPVVDELRKQVSTLHLESYVAIPGAVAKNEIADYIGAMDICALPDSNPFGSPMVLFEFMALGKPVVAPRLAPIEDVLTNGVTGLTFPPGDQEALRQAIALLAADPELRARIGSEARSQVLAKRTWQANAATIIHEIERVKAASLIAELR